VGSWILAASGPTTAVAAARAWTGLFPRMAVLCRPAAAALGPALSTYTGALLAQTAVPVWHESRTTLPFVFAAGSAASAGAVAVAVTPPSHAGAARRLAVGGAALELVATQAMERRLGEHGEPYHAGAAGKLGRAAIALTALGGGVIAARAARSRAAAVAGGTLLAAGALCERWSVFRAGFQSAADPKYVVGPQRRRIERGEARGGARPSAV
jgi:hypothetical protein